MTQPADPPTQGDMADPDPIGVPAGVASTRGDTTGCTAADVVMTQPSRSVEDTRQQPQAAKGTPDRRARAARAWGPILVAAAAVTAAAPYLYALGRLLI